MSIETHDVLTMLGSSGLTTLIIHLLNRKKNKLDEKKSEVSIIKDLLEITTSDLMRYREDFDYLKKVNLEVLSQNKVLLQENDKLRLELKAQMQENQILKTNITKQDEVIKEFRKNNAELTRRFEELQAKVNQYQSDHEK